MIENLPRELLWSDKISLVEFLNDPVTQGLINTYINETEKKDQDEFFILRLLNEAYYQATRIVYENNARINFNELELSIVAYIGRPQMIKYVYSMIFALLRFQKKRYVYSRYNEKKLLKNASNGGMGGIVFFGQDFIPPSDSYSTKLRPNPVSVNKLETIGIDWGELTGHFSEKYISEIISLWNNTYEQIAVLKHIQGEYIRWERMNRVMKRSPVRPADIQTDFDLSIRIRLLKRDLEKYGDIDGSSSPLDNNDGYSAKIHDLEQLVSKLKDENQILKSNINMSKKKKDQVLSFTLDRIVEYIYGLTSFEMASPIYTMLCTFLLDGCSEEDKTKVLKIQKEFNKRSRNPLVGKVNSMSINSPIFEGSMYDVKDNQEVNFGGKDDYDRE